MWNKLNRVSKTKVALVTVVSGFCGIIIEGMRKSGVEFISNKCDEFLDKASELKMSKSTYSSNDINDKQLQKFLEHIYLSEINEVKNMLQINPGLAFAPGNFCDYGKRCFKQVTGLQYAVWASDYLIFKEIISIIKDVVDKNDIKKQLEALCCYGDGIEIIEPRLDKWWDLPRPLEPLNLLKSLYNDNDFKRSKIDTSLEQLIKKIEASQQAYPSHNYRDSSDAWLEIGCAQLILPAHVIKEFLTQTKNFEHGKKSEVPASEISREKFNLWYEENSDKLGKDFAHVRGGGPKCRSWRPKSWYMRPFVALADTRILDTFRITGDIVTVLSKDRAAMLQMLLEGWKEREKLFNDYELLPKKRISNGLNRYKYQP